MNKKSIFGLLIALGVPVICYLILKSATDQAVNMPRKYFFDTVLTSVKDGKVVNDTIWHKTANIVLKNQLGDTVALYDKPGKIIVADFFFTSCRSICPRLTKNMANLQQSFKKGGNVRNKIDTSVVQFLSFSVDPDNDSSEVLKQYADRFGVNHDNWWLLTGNRNKIYQFAFEELKVDQFSEEPISPDFVHTSRFVLIDKGYLVRGFYNGLDSADMLRLSRDIGILMLEKDRKAKNGIFQQIIDLAWLWFIIVVAIAFFVMYIRKNHKS